MTQETFQENHLKHLYQQILIFFGYMFMFSMCLQELLKTPRLKAAQQRPGEARAEAGRAAIGTRRLFDDEAEVGRCAT